MKIKRWLTFISSVLAFILLAESGAMAVEPDLLFGQSHYYSVVMRGNGESIVYAKINLTNSGDTPLTEYGFEIPKLKVNEIAGYQVVVPQSCQAYAVPDAKSTSSLIRPCLRYDDTDISGGYVPVGAEFAKLKITDQGGGRYSAKLPNAIAQNKAGLIVLSYAGTGYVKKSFGVSSFNFETLKVPNRIKAVSVSVDVDSELVLEGQRSKVNYATSAKEAVGTGASLDGASTNSLRNIADSIGINYGGLYRDAKNLSANETLTVKGRYAESTWVLNRVNVIIGSLIVVGLLILLVWFGRRYRRRHAHQVMAAESAQATPAKAHITEPIYVIAGFVSAAVVSAATVVLSITSNSNQYYSGETDVISTVMIGLLIIIFYVLVVLGPAIWLATSRRDWRVLLYVIIWEFGWLLAFMALYQFGYKSLFGQSNPIPTASPQIDCPNC